MKLVICGDSHVVKIENALHDHRNEIATSFPGEIRVGKLFSFPKTLNSFFEEREDDILFTKGDAKRSFGKLTGTGSFSRNSIYLLSLFFTTTILIRSSRWGTHLPTRVCRPGFHPVSDAVMEAIVLDHFGQGIAFATALLQRGIPIMALESPPPRGDDPALRRYVKPAEALEIDRVARLVMKAKLRAMNVPVVEMPAFAADPTSGFLAPRYHAERPGDYHHANSALGLVMLREALQTAARLHPVTQS